MAADDKSTLLPMTDPLIVGPYDTPDFAWLADYFHQVESAFDSAQRRPGGTLLVARRLAGRTVRFSFAGESLRPVLLRALAHLDRARDSVATDLDILCWDTRETGVELPRAPWQWPDAAARVQIALPAAAPFRVFATPSLDTVTFFDVRRRRAFFCTADARRLPTHWHGSPLLDLFSSWAGTQHLQLLHAGCVGTEAGGVLLAGRAGSGKSTAVLSATISGLSYVSDDWCLLETGSPPIAHSLYSTGKLHRNHLARFPALQPVAFDPVTDEFDKPVIFVHEAFPGRAVSALSLRAVVLPMQFDSLPGNRHRISSGEALRALAPTTLLNLPGSRTHGLTFMADVVRRLPCFRIELGSNPADVARHIQGLLQELAS